MLHTFPYHGLRIYVHEVHGLFVKDTLVFLQMSIDRGVGSFEEALRHFVEGTL